MPYYNKDPKRDPNFDNHPSLSLRIKVLSLEQNPNTEVGIVLCTASLHDEESTLHPLRIRAFARWLLFCVSFGICKVIVGLVGNARDLGILHSMFACLLRCL